MPEHPRKLVIVVPPQRHGMGEHFTKDSGPSLLQHVSGRTVQCSKQSDTRLIVGGLMRLWRESAAPPYDSQP